MQRAQSAQPRPVLSRSLSQRRPHGGAVAPLTLSPARGLGPIGAGEAAVSGCTSLQGTARTGAATTIFPTYDQTPASHYRLLGLQDEALRIYRILTSDEIAILSEMYYRRFGSHITPSMLRVYLTSVGVQLPTTATSASASHVADDDLILREKLVKAVELQSAFQLCKRTSLAAGRDPTHRPSTAGVMQRALVKVLSARRLSVAAAAGTSSAQHPRLSARAPSLLSTPKNGPLVASQRSTNSDDGAALLVGKSTTPVPPTLSLDLIIWVARILKDEAAVRAGAASIAENPEILEAFRSCVDETTGTVTLRSVMERCNQFEVQLSLNPQKRKGRKRKSSSPSASRSRDDIAAMPRPFAADDTAGANLEDVDQSSDDDAPPTAAATFELDPAQFARLLRLRDQRQSNISAHQEEQDPKRVPVVAASPAFIHAGTSSSSSSDDDEVGSNGRGSMRRPKTAAGSCSPKRFVTVPYTDGELRLFEEAVGGGAGDAQQHASLTGADDAQHQVMFANALLGTSTCVRNRCRSAPTPASGRCHAPRHATHPSHAARIAVTAPDDPPSTNNSNNNMANLPSDASVVSHSSIEKPSSVATAATAASPIFSSYFLCSDVSRSVSLGHPLGSAVGSSSAGGRGPLPEVGPRHVAQGQPPQPAISLGVVNNFNSWPQATSPPHHLPGHHLELMLEDQETALRVHPTRAALVGSYYHDIAHQRSTALTTVAAEAAASAEGVGLDEQFPLRGGLSWALSLGRKHTPHHNPNDGTTPPVNNTKGCPDVVVARLTKQHSEQPAISLYRLQQRLAMLESGDRAQSGGDQKKGGVATHLTATQRLQKFRKVVSPMSQTRSLAARTHHNADGQLPPRPSTAF